MTWTVGQTVHVSADPEAQRIAKERAAVRLAERRVEVETAFAAAGFVPGKASYPVTKTNEAELDDVAEENWLRNAQGILTSRQQRVERHAGKRGSLTGVRDGMAADDPLRVRAEFELAELDREHAKQLGHCDELLARYGWKPSTKASKAEVG